MIVAFRVHYEPALLQDRQDLSELGLRVGFKV